MSCHSDSNWTNTYYIIAWKREVQMVYQQDARGNHAGAYSQSSLAPQPSLKEKLLL